MPALARSKPSAGWTLATAGWRGPRRFGKTSPLRAALAGAEHDGAVAIEVNFLGCVTAADVARRIERAAARSSTHGCAAGTTA